MRTDETGGECPATLGEYRDLCHALGQTGNAAVAFLDAKIGPPGNQGRDMRVIAEDSQMRFILMPLIIRLPLPGEFARPEGVDAIGRNMPFSADAYNGAMQQAALHAGELAGCAMHLPAGAKRDQSEVAFKALREALVELAALVSANPLSVHVRRPQ
jgi:hypothetical protein